MELSAQQKCAVEHMGSPALVVAGAGSGKTRTLTAKISHLVAQGYDPERILAITFTNKAADEMKHRLVALTGMPLKRFPWVRTYHSACFQILKAHCGLLGYSSPVQVYATYQQHKIIKDILLRANHDKKHVPAVAAQLSKAKNSGDPLKYLQYHPYVFTIRLVDVFDRYEAELKSKNAVDFDNILLKVRDLLRKCKDVRSDYQRLFEYLLVDEYQDTNNLQEELTRLLLKNGNLFCVGDDWQAVYSFRGSNVDHFLSFSEKYKGAKVYHLEQNYRSADEIVHAANLLIENNRGKMEKKCFSAKRGGVVDMCSFFNEKEEAQWVSGKIRSFCDQGIPYSKMAVLYRTKFCSLSFEQVFRARGIPYQMVGGKGFFDRKEIMDLNFYLTAAVFTKDDVAFERILNVPKRGIGPGAVKKIFQAGSDRMGLQEAARRALREKLLAPKLYASLNQVIGLLDDIKALKPAEAIRQVIASTKYMAYIEQYARSNSMDHASRLENIEQLLFSASAKDSILDYLEEAALVREDKGEAESERSEGAVKLSTIHASKGLEFKVVFVVGCEETLLPHWKSMGSAAELEEERRLMYVSMTRSETFLFLSSADYRKGQCNRRSRFLDEIEKSLT